MLRRPEAALFAIALASYAYFYQAGGWNQNSRFDLTRALVERGTARIDAYAHNTGDLACVGPDGRCARARPGVDRLYSDKAPGVSWLALPAHAVFHALAGEAGSDEASLAAASYLATLWAIALPAAAGAVALFVLLGRLAVPARPRSELTLAYALASLAFPYATLFYGHQLAAALLAIAFAALAPAARPAARPAAPLGAGAAGAAGACLGAAVVVEFSAALAALALCAYAWQRSGGGRGPRLAFAAGAAVPAAALVLHHTLLFGGPLALAYSFSTQPHRGSGAFMGIGWPSGEALWGVTFSAYRGLFVSAPWLVLALPGVACLWRRRRAEAAVCAAVAAGFLWLNASLVDWSGGWAPGPRYLVPSLPFWAVAVGGLALPGAAAAWTRAAWGAFRVAAVCAALAMLAATAVKPEVPDGIRSPYTQYLLPRLLAGDLAVSTQTFDMPSAPERAPRAAWNLGQRLGLPGLWSLAPLLLAWTLGALWLRAALRGEARRSGSRPPA